MDHNYDDNEISLKELIMILIKGKMTILWVTLIVVLLAGIYMFFIAEEKYESSVEGTIAITETTISKYGEYTFPSKNKMDYLNVLTSEEVLKRVIANLNLKMSPRALESSISLVTELDSSSFEIKVQAGSAELSERIVDELATVFIQTLNMNYKSYAVDLFIRDFYVKTRTDLELIEKQEKSIVALKEQLAASSPTITLKKIITSDPELAAKIASEKGVSLESLSEDIMYEEISNPAYEKIEESIVLAEATLIDLKVNLEQNNKLYEELKTIEAEINTYYETGSTEPIGDGSLEFMKSKVAISSFVASSDDPVAPNKVLILAIGVVLGLMLGMFVAFFKSYWMNN